MYTDTRDVLMTLHFSREVMLKEPILLEIDAPLKILGDVHGQVRW